MPEYIDRDAVYHAISVDGGLNEYEKAYCIDVVRKIPDADVDPVRHGRWILVDTDEEQFFICSECENKEYWESDYCPNCGAKMDKED